MKKSRCTESQIIKFLHEVEGGRMIKDVCRVYPVSLNVMPLMEVAVCSLRLIFQADIIYSSLIFSLSILYRKIGLRII
jgi:hypothetical protein